MVTILMWISTVSLVVMVNVVVLDTLISAVRSRELIPRLGGIAFVAFVVAAELAGALYLYGLPSR